MKVKTDFHLSSFIKGSFFFFLVLWAWGLGSGRPAGAETLFQENFEDSNLAARGWYDNTNLRLSSVEHIPGSTKSAEFRFLKGATMPVSGANIRKLFTPTDQLYVSYYVKYSSNWQGSNKTYHPHEFYILTNKDGVWTGPAYTALTFYIEQNEGVPMLVIQDGRNVDESRIGVNLTQVTENRAVAGCNGSSDSYPAGSCYPNGSVHWNGKGWKADRAYFSDSPGPYYKADWHKVEAFVKLNSLVNGKAVADGIVQYWFDGQLIINHTKVVLRTGQHPDMRFNQFQIGPWIGDGSPVEQTMWLDNLTVATSRGSADVNPPASPGNLREVK